MGIAIVDVIINKARKLFIVGLSGIIVGGKRNNSPNVLKEFPMVKIMGMAIKIHMGINIA
jgi:hypothetical protein